jgi:hypothetical protein
VIIAAMRWIVTLSGSAKDVDRVLGEAVPDLSRDATDRGDLFLELHGSGQDETSDEARHAVKADSDLRVRHINGFGRLRWGRNFEGITIKAVRSMDSTGKETQHIFPRTAHGHMLPRDFADMVERLGSPRPPLPVGLDVIEALDGSAVTALAESIPMVGRVLHLVELMLEGDEHDLSARQIDGVACGWWTKTERRNFRKTANSAEALGVLARHGKPGGVAEPQMTDSEASWYVRRVTAYWLARLLGAVVQGS